MPDRTVRSHQSGIARSTWLRWGGGIAAIVLALLFALTFGPHLFRDRIAARVAESIGRSVSVEAVETSPLRGGLTLRNVTVGGREGEQALLEVPEAALQLSVPKLLRGDLQFDAVTLQSPTLRIARVDPKRFDFYDIVERLGEGRDGDTADPTLVTIEQLQINDGTIVFEDRVLERTIEITQIEGRLPWFSTRPDDRDRPIQGDVRFTIDGRPARIQ
ncbi:MAG TPA: AsmA family protein, partial [Burkholderiaceae bacterium]|nr:AsmA family protein [Burkholderiaceae bacterium]